MYSVLWTQPSRMYTSSLHTLEHCSGDILWMFHTLFWILKPACQAPPRWWLPFCDVRCDVIWRGWIMVDARIIDIMWSRITHHVCVIAGQAIIVSTPYAISLCITGDWIIYQSSFSREVRIVHIQIWYIADIHSRTFSIIMSDSFRGVQRYRSLRHAACHYWGHARLIYGVFGNCRFRGHRLRRYSISWIVRYCSVRLDEVAFSSGDFGARSFRLLPLLVSGLVTVELTLRFPSEIAVDVMVRFTRSLHITNLHWYIAIIFLINRPGR